MVSLSETANKFATPNSTLRERVELPEGLTAVVDRAVYTPRPPNRIRPCPLSRNLFRD